MRAPRKLARHGEQVNGAALQEPQKASRKIKRTLQLVGLIVAGVLAAAVAIAQSSMLTIVMRGLRLGGSPS